MLIEALLYFFTTVITAILSILPAGGTFPPEIANAIGWLFSFLRSYDFIVPYDTLIACISIGLFWEVFCLIWWLVHWILRKIPVLHIT